MSISAYKFESGFVYMVSLYVLVVIRRIKQI